MTDDAFEDGNNPLMIMRLVGRRLAFVIWKWLTQGAEILRRGAWVVLTVPSVALANE